MSAFDLSYPDPTRDAMIGKPDRCFLCGAAVNGIVVYWHGLAGVVFLHPGCAKDLGCHLIGDFVRAKQMSSKTVAQTRYTGHNGKPPTVGSGWGLVTVNPAIGVRVVMETVHPCSRTALAPASMELCLCHSTLSICFDAVSARCVALP